jgi:hypothetical protein
MSRQLSVDTVLPGLRGAILGAVFASNVVAGTRVVLSQTAAGQIGPMVVIATALIAAAVGLWAGTSGQSEDPPRPRERWIPAGALTAVAGGYTTFATFYAQVYPSPLWQLASLILAVGIPAYALGMVPPALWASARAAQDEADDVSAPATPGGMTIGLLLGAAAGTVVATLLDPVLAPGPLFMGGSLVLLLPLGFTESASVPSRETTVFETVTPFAELKVTQVTFDGERQPERRLYLNEEEESGELVRSGAPTLAYVAAAESWLTTTTPVASEYLFLGGGAHTLPRRIAEWDPRARITVVELDPEVTRIAYRYFGLRSHHRITSVHGDARAFLQAPGDRTYDRIYVDVYGGAETLPHSLVTYEAALDFRRRLKPGGCLGINVIGRVVGDHLVQPWSVVATFAEVFPFLAVHTHLGRDYPERQNLLILAAGEAGVEMRSVVLFEPWPRDDWPTPPGVTVLHDLAGERDRDERTAHRPAPSPLPRPRERQA